MKTNTSVPYTFYTSPWLGYAIVECISGMYELVNNGWGGISALPLSEDQIEESGDNMLEMEGVVEDGSWISEVYCLSFNLKEVEDSIERISQ